MKIKKLIKSLEPVFIFILFLLFAKISIQLSGLEDFVTAMFLVFSYLYAKLNSRISKTEKLQEQKNEH